MIRGDDLYKSMSSYLVHRIEQTSNIKVIRNAEVKCLKGDDHLRELELLDRKTGEIRSFTTPAIFSFIGATPRTEWVPVEIDKDDKGFIQTGPAVSQSTRWDSPRDPFLLETSRRGVFAAGDVRSGSTKRVGSAVGEGAMAVQFVHQYLRKL